MAQYTIEQFSKITGFSKLLIRTWENRYNLFVPGRTSKNIRFYYDSALIKGFADYFHNETLLFRWYKF